MIFEEYDYSSVSDFIQNDVELLVSGFENQEERSAYMFEKWNSQLKKIVRLGRISRDRVKVCFFDRGQKQSEVELDICCGLPVFFSEIRISELSVLVDLSSLDHILIMVLTKQLLTQSVPKSLFASYIRPERYISESGSIGYNLSNQVSAVSSVPGFARRETEQEILCAFLGFEGTRLKGVIETVHGIDYVVPVVAFPSEKPHWFNVSIWNCMEVLGSEVENVTIHRCLSDSVFEAVELLRKTIPQEAKVVLAPLGTRPHSMACAIFACEHRWSRIIYDYVTENEHRAIGISKILIFHLSNFIIQ